jgi:HlyD family secretion protein
VVLHLEEGRRIFAGLTANVDVDVETLDEVIVVPSQAIVDRRIDDLPKSVRDESDLIVETRTFTRAVFVRNDEKAHLRPVRIAASNLRRTAVLAGLEPGDEVIVGPFRSLQDLNHEATVRLREPEEEAEALAEEDAEEPAADSVADAEGG